MEQSNVGWLEFNRPCGTTEVTNRLPGALAQDETEADFCSETGGGHDENVEAKVGPHRVLA